MHVLDFVEFAWRTLRHLAHPLETASAFLRYVSHTLRLAEYGRRMRRSKPLRYLGVVPRTPLPLYTLWGVAQVLGLTLQPRRSGTTVLFVDLTKVPVAKVPAGSNAWINGSCTDISKTRVAEVFTKVTGRALAVDPRTHTGAMVEKSDENGYHDGRVVQGPLIEARRGRVYQRLIDNANDGAGVEDLRIAIVGTRIPVIYRKQRRLSRRFESSSKQTELADPESALSPEERQEMLSVSRALGLDFGELDVLRDRADKKLYVVDANKTSISPPIDLPFHKRLEALKTIGTAFEEEFLHGNT